MVLGRRSVRLLLTGASGQLGSYLLKALAHRQLEVTAWSATAPGQHFGVPLRPVDFCDPGAVRAALDVTMPGVILHAAALSSVAECYRDPDRARRVNVEGTAILRDHAERHGARLVFVSTDMVFDGERGGYREGDSPNPLSAYGRTKRDAEAVVAALPGAVVVRASLLYGPSQSGRPTSFDEQVTALRQGRAVTLFHDEWRTPLDLETATGALIAIATSDVTGVLHLGGPERLSRLEMGERLARQLGADPALLVGASRLSAGPEPRPRDASLDSSRFRSLFPGLPWPTYAGAVASYLRKGG